MKKIKSDYENALLHSDKKIQLQLLKQINENLIKIIIDPESTKKEKVEAYEFISLISFSAN